MQDLLIYKPSVKINFWWTIAIEFNLLIIREVTTCYIMITFCTTC